MLDTQRWLSIWEMVKLYDCFYFVDNEAEMDEQVLYPKYNK